MAIVVQLNKSYIEAWNDCYISEYKKAGYVAALQLSSKKQTFYGLNDLDRLLKKAAAKDQDVYLSLNAFQYGSRKAADLKQIRNIGVDIDSYKIGLSPDQAAEAVRDLIVQGKVPNPNLLIRSGRGLQLVYSIAGGASPTMVFLSQYITGQYIAELKDLGADTAATDPSRVFRLPGSINSKNGQLVTVETWRTLEYSLEELYSFCTPLEKPRKWGRTGKNNIVPFTVPAGLMNLHSLNFQRKTDLEMLVQLRNGEMTGYRNTTLYIYSYISALYAKNKTDTFYYADQLNSSFTEPLKKKDVTTAVNSAFSDAITYFEEFQKRDYKRWYKQNDGIIKPMKNSTIIEKLEITAAEAANLRTIISQEVKNSRFKEYRRKQRGSVSREEYREQQRDQTEDKVWQLEQAMQRYPGKKQKEYAEMLGVTPMRISQLIREIKK